MSIQVSKVDKWFGSYKALDGVTLEVPDGKLFALLGPSGSGKTTLLRTIAGFEAPDAGLVQFDGLDVTGHRVGERNVGFVFQHYALFRHMSVFENVAFGLRVKPRRDRPSKVEIRDKVMELLKLVQLDAFASRKPSELSGGQRQRVALARALAVEPKVLLLDEPFGALDAKVRQELRSWLRRLHDEIHVTSVFVTHDQEEALEVADQIVVMNQGRVEQIGTPEEVYEHPRTPFVYNFLGNVNLFHGRTESEDLVGSLSEVAFGGAGVVGFVRPHELEVSRTEAGAKSMSAIVRHLMSAGPTARIKLELSENGTMVEAQVSQETYGHLDLKVGDHVFVKPRKVRVFPEDYSI
jgi:sulfate transport system ATP-binding protein